MRRLSLFLPLLSLTLAGCSGDDGGTTSFTASGTASAGTTVTASGTAGTDGTTSGTSAGSDSASGTDSATDSAGTTTGATTGATGSTSDSAGTGGSGGSTGGTSGGSGGSTSGGSTGGASGSTSGGSTGGVTAGGTTGGQVDPCLVIPVTYHDLKPDHVDFGCHMWGNGERPGLVLDAIGGDQKPQYNATPPAAPIGWNGSVPQITSGTSFLDWYNDKANVSQSIPGQIVLEETAPNSGIYSFESADFYPLTGMGFGNNTQANWTGYTYPNVNAAFTTEIHVEFTYEVGQEFTFIGDDDVWVYIDGQLALDLGGLHGMEQATIQLDTLGLTAGTKYKMDVFHAERCGAGSYFRIDTSIECLLPQ